MSERNSEKFAAPLLGARSRGVLEWGTRQTLQLEAFSWQLCTETLALLCERVAHAHCLHHNVELLQCVSVRQVC